MTVTPSLVDVAELEGRAQGATTVLAAMVDGAHAAGEVDLPAGIVEAVDRYRSAVAAWRAAVDAL